MSIVRKVLSVSSGSGVAYTVPAGKYAEIYPQQVQSGFGTGINIGEVEFPAGGFFSIYYATETEAGNPDGMQRAPIVLYPGQVIDATGGSIEAVILEYNMP